MQLLLNLVIGCWKFAEKLNVLGVDLLLASMAKCSLRIFKLHLLMKDLAVNGAVYMYTGGLA